MKSRPDYPEAHSSPRPPPTVILKDAWQVQHEDDHKRGTSAGQPVAYEGKMEPEIDSRIPGISHAAVEQEDDNRTRLIRENALIADLQINREEAKQMIHTLGNVECFELCVISPKVQCLCIFEVLDRRVRLLYLWHMLSSHRIYTKHE